jgi:hypothetical protein
LFKHILIHTDGSPVANKAAKTGVALERRGPLQANYGWRHAEIAGPLQDTGGGVPVNQGDAAERQVTAHKPKESLWNTSMNRTAMLR